MKILFSFLVLIIGTLLALQGVINAKLSTHLNHPIQAAVLSFCVGLSSLLFVSLLVKPTLPSTSQLMAIPPYLLIGGLFGAIMVSSAIILIPQMGATPFIGGIIVGQLLGAMTFDHFGILGLPIQAINGKRILGVLLLVAGFFLTRK